MTISELEQGIRNLIASKPAVLSGALGEVIHGVLSIVEAYHEFSLSVQTYPGQDMLKFSLVGASQNMEATVTNLVSLVLQERGINISLYTPNAAEYGKALGPMNAGKFGGGLEFKAAPAASQKTAEKIDFAVGDFGNVKATGSEAEEKIPTPSGRPMFAEGEEYEAETAVGGATKESAVEVPVASSSDNSDAQSGGDYAFDFPTPKKAGQPASSEGRDYLIELLKK